MSRTSPESPTRSYPRKSIALHAAVRRRYGHKDRSTGSRLQRSELVAHHLEGFLNRAIPRSEIPPRKRDTFRRNHRESMLSARRRVALFKEEAQRCESTLTPLHLREVPIPQPKANCPIRLRHPLDDSPTKAEYSPRQQSRARSRLRTLNKTSPTTRLPMKARVAPRRGSSTQAATGWDDYQDRP
jgi:hypothetical protein